MPVLYSTQNKALNTMLIHPRRRSFISSRLLNASAALLCFSSVAGCQPSMTTQTSSPASAERTYTGTVQDWPLFFKHHDFGVACFDTQSCLVRYNGFEFGTPEQTRPASALSKQEYNAALTARYGPVARMAAPATVSWTSKAGDKLQAEVDIAEIFKDGLIRHDTPREDIAEDVSMGATHVLLEVNDRTVKVLTRTMIPLKQPRDPQNPNSDFRDDLIEVYSHTY
jgi:hypothetical protein